MRYQEFDPPLLPGEERYISPGRSQTADDGSTEGDCPATCSGLACTLDKEHTGRHVAHGLEFIDGQRVDVMYAEWDEEDAQKEDKQ